MTQRIIRLKEVQHLTGLSRSSIYQFMSNRQFPQSISLNSRVTGWRLEDIESWILSRIAIRDEKMAGADNND
ncbi:TPA: AlpA family phage regulatory protein [Vibrio vulnificus]|nr:AlpA family phage regulatory protein [Vibrio vulnificus]